MYLIRDFHFKINFLSTRDLLLRLDISNSFKIQEKKISKILMELFFLITMLKNRILK